MSKTVSFKCDESSTDLFVKILNRLSVAGERNQTRKIRVGGDEYVFMGGSDTVKDLSIDGKIYSDMSPSEQRDLEILRAAVVTSPNTNPVVVGVAVIDNSIAPNVPVQTSDGNSQPDDDADILDSAEGVAVRGVVASKVTQGQMFTAFDVTKELRSNGNQVRHNNIKHIVHALYNQGDMQGYNRSLIDVSGTSIRPFLYHPTSADTSTYA